MLKDEAAVMEQSLDNEILQKDVEQDEHSIDAENQDLDED